ncbi:hypothetical protein [Mycetocola reblochoni]|uniref:Uncharacterized protein n=2 Tax=Mycetocola reblochoni TaxID=331618 RepID=A0A1R4K7M9_9MICO|nr:hypothetical protein [Mycetocola reblochoni]RLP67829.1 hypothetical protein D9V30_12660 [Mycetocola reblochoni]SJN40431.1 hypothetical protein FM119_11960 [Mycetocola reblochoni REB411]
MSAEAKPEDGTGRTPEGGTNATPQDVAAVPEGGAETTTPPDGAATVPVTAPAGGPAGGPAATPGDRAEPVRGAAAPAAPLRPRLRVGAVVWGTLTLLLALAAVVVGSDPDRRDALADAIWTLPPSGAAAVALATVGGVIVLVALTRLLARVGDRDSLDR